MSSTLIAGGALLVSFVALILSVASNVRGYSVHQRQLNLERMMQKLEQADQNSDPAE